MTIIRANPTSVIDYGKLATSTFGDIISALQTNVDDLVAIRYEGPNAAAFKRQIGTLSATFGNGLYLDILAMATAVHTATSNIAASLGGTAMTIEITETKITVPDIAESEIVDLDTTGLEAAPKMVTTKFTRRCEQLNAHRDALAATDWSGAAKDAVVTSVSTYTKNAVGRCTDTEAAIIDYITTQLESTLLADASVSTG